MNFENLFADFSSLHVAVIGDVMLDTYWWGNVERISPEAPVPVVAMQHREQRIGGAGNVALNTVSLGAQTTLFTITGNDDDAKTLSNLLQQHNINTKYIVQSDKRITTNKIRVMSRNQQMLRLDSEITNDILSNDETQLLNNFSSYIKTAKPAVVIFEDYNKGVLTPTLIQSIIKICKDNNIITAVDPKRKNFFEYKNVDIFKPNLKEVKDGLNILIDDVSNEVLETIHQELHNLLHHKVSLITLSEKGIFIHDENTSKIIPAHVRNIADVSGAGDTVIAVASLVYAATKDILLTAEIANLAGGIVCEEVGTVAITKEKLLNECKELVANNSESFQSIH
ncbi:MAG TPA: bifunctional ADP-heptose synthase [Parafilimonas sp.]|nr:bifunctional ADP-heptose synthase [Parafilimonas sp.]